MTLIIETWCSTQDQSSIKVLSASHTLCTFSLWSEESVGSERVPPAEWERSLGSLPRQSWQPEVRVFSNLPPASRLLKSICQAETFRVAQAALASPSGLQGLVLPAVKLRWVEEVENGGLRLGRPLTTAYVEGDTSMCTVILGTGVQ